jgi:hypothetical protein
LKIILLLPWLFVEWSWYVLFGLLVILRNPIRFTHYVRVYRDVENDLANIEITADYRRLPRAERRALDLANKRETKKIRRAIA